MKRLFLPLVLALSYALAGAAVAGVFGTPAGGWGVVGPADPPPVMRPRP